jgi:hypothetical protein
LEQTYRHTQDGEYGYKHTWDAGIVRDCAGDQQRDAGEQGHPIVGAMPEDDCGDGNAYGREDGVDTNIVHRKKARRQLREIQSTRCTLIIGVSNE